MEYFLELHHRLVHLLMCMCSHQGISDQSVGGSTCRRYHGIDEHTLLEGTCHHDECLLKVTNVEGNDGTLCLAYLESFLAEPLQGIIGDIP